MDIRDDALLLSGFLLALKPDAPAYILQAIDRIVSPGFIIADTAKIGADGFARTILKESHRVAPVCDTPTPLSAEDVKKYYNGMVNLFSKEYQVPERMLRGEARPEPSPKISAGIKDDPLNQSQPDPQITKELTGIDIKEPADYGVKEDLKNLGFGRPIIPCGDCEDGACTMNCSSPRCLMPKAVPTADSPPPPPPRRNAPAYTPEEIQQAIDAGKSVPSIAKQHHVTEASIYTFVKKHRLNLNSFWTPDRTATCFMMMHNGSTPAQVMARIGGDSTRAIQNRYAYLQKNNYVPPGIPYALPEGSPTIDRPDPTVKDENPGNQ